MVGKRTAVISAFSSEDSDAAYSNFFCHSYIHTYHYTQGSPSPKHFSRSCDKVGVNKLTGFRRHSSYRHIIRYAYWRDDLSPKINHVAPKEE